MNNCWGFVGETVIAVCRTQEGTCYKIFSDKSLDGPYKGKEHDSGMLADSGLLESWSNPSFSPVYSYICGMDFRRHN